MLPGILEALPEGRGKGPVLLPVYPCPSVSGCLVCGECVCLLQWVPSQAAMWHLYVLFFFPCSPSCFPLCHLGSPLAASFSSLLLPFSQRTAALSPVYPMAYWRSQMPSTICPGCLHHTLSWVLNSQPWTCWHSAAVLALSRLMPLYRGFLCLEGSLPSLLMKSTLSLKLQHFGISLSWFLRTLLGSIGYPLHWASRHCVHIL